MGKGKSQHQDFWDIQLSKSETAMTERNLKDVITLSTQTLNKFMETYAIKLLYLRATAHEKSGLLSRALEDAKLMIQYVPKSPAGYLKAGHVFMTHGKPSSAVDIYKKGLEVVSKLDRQYQSMQEEHDKAVLRAHSRFDIVGNLPREIVHKILINLDSERVWICLNVSKRWCQQVSRCGTWWSSVTVKQTGTEIDQAVCDAIPLVKDYIQRLEITNLSSSDLNKKYLKHLKFGVFTNLKMLSLEGAFFHNILSEDLAIALWLVRGTLKSLKIDFGSGKSFPLMLVLGSCPDIEELCYTTTDDILLWNADSEYASGCEKLSSLELSFKRTTYSVLYSHLALCPNLRRLIIKPFALEGSGSCTVTDYCPKLKLFGLNSSEGLPDVDIREYPTDETGVVYMSADCDNHFDWIQTQTLVDAQAHSLQQLTIIHTKSGGAAYMQRRADSSAATFSKLTTLQYISRKDNTSYYDSYYHDRDLTYTIQEFVGSIIQKSPRLGSLSLIGGLHHRGCIRTPLEQAVKRNIQTLTLTSISFCSTSSDWYRSFYSSLDRVQSLVLHDIDMSEDRLLCLAASESVQQLKLIECTGISNGDLNDFLKQIALKSSQQLNTLDINNLSVSMDNSAIRNLTKINSLKTLRITSCKNVNADFVNDLINYVTSSSLTTIEVLDCFPADIAVSWSDAVVRLKKKGITLVIE